MAVRKLRFPPRAIAVIVILSAAGFASRPAADSDPAVVAPAGPDAAAASLSDVAAYRDAAAPGVAGDETGYGVAGGDTAGAAGRLSEPAGDVTP